MAYWFIETRTRGSTFKRQAWKSLLPGRGRFIWYRNLALSRQSECECGPRIIASMDIIDTSITAGTSAEDAISKASLQHVWRMTSRQQLFTWKPLYWSTRTTHQFDTDWDDNDHLLLNTDVTCQLPTDARNVLHKWQVDRITIDLLNTSQEFTSTHSPFFLFFWLFFNFWAFFGFLDFLAFYFFVFQSCDGGRDDHPTDPSGDNAEVMHATANHSYEWRVVENPSRTWRLASIHLVMIFVVVIH